MAEGEVVFHRIIRVEAAERGGDLLGGAPRCVLPAREAEVPRDAVHVRVERDDERRGRDVPEAEIHAVASTRHPAQVQKQALAGAPLLGRRHEVTKPARGVPSAEFCGELGEGRPEPSVTSMERLERPAEAPRASPHVARASEQASDVLAGVDSMTETAEGASERGLFGLVDGAGRAGTERGQDLLDARPNGDHLAESER